jgi:hypothetical protein
MKTFFLPTEVVYTGAELRPGWIAEQFPHEEVPGDHVILAFIGPAKVRTPEMVDIEDRKGEVFEGDLAIMSDHMLHFLIELFGYGIRETVLFQRWFVEIVANRINLMRDREDSWVYTVGDDLWIDYMEDPTAKLSVSIATASAVSGLIHLGLNIENDGTPDEIEIACLEDIIVDPVELLKDVLDEVEKRYMSMMAAMCKVLPR